jgi:hypothetical protein
MKKIILIPIVLFLLFPTLISAGTQQDLYDAALVIWHPSVNLSIDNSSLNNLGTPSSSVTYETGVKKLGDASGDFRGGNVTFFDNGNFSSVINFTICVWSNFTTSGLTYSNIVTRRDSVNDGFWSLRVEDTDLNLGFHSNYNALTTPTTASATYPMTDFSANTDFELICGVSNQTNTSRTTAQLYINATVVAEGYHEAGTTTIDDPLTIGRLGVGDSTTSYRGGLDQVMFFNISLTSSDIDFLWNSGAGFYLVPETEADTTPSTFTLTAIDDYDSLAINNFTAIISNSTDVYINTTTTGSLTWDNLTGLYNITINSTEGGGYYNKTFGIKNISSDFQGNLTQSYLSLNVTDLLSGSGLSSFTVYTNYSTHTGTDGYILLPSKAGFHTFNITSSQYPLHEFSYSISATENLSFVANISPSFNFYLRREADNSIFDVNKTNTTKLTIYRPDKSIDIHFKNETYNSTEENATIDCAYTLMKMDVTYTSSTYLRTLKPPTTQQNVTWYLLDLNKDTGVQIILELVDLTGDWSEGSLKIVTAVAGINEEIIEQDFDISTSVTAYLLKDGLYTISIINNDGTEEKQLGTLIADAAGTKTITFPNIEFYPDETILETNTSWSYTFNTTTNILRLQYVDSSKNTDLIRWRIYNGSNESHLMQTFSSTLDTVTFTHQPIYQNQSYFTHLHIEHSLLNFNVSEYKTFGELYADLPSTEGWTAEEEADIKHYFAILFLVVLGLLFSAKHAGLGLTLVFVFTWVLRQWGWFLIHPAWLGVIGFAAIGGWVYESIKKG